MIIKCLFVLQNNTVELWDAMDEYSDENNPDYLIQEEKEAMKEVIEGNLTWVKRIDIEVDNEDLRNALFPTVKAK